MRGASGRITSVLQALPHLASAMPEDANIGMGLLEQALKLDPTYAAAHAYLAWSLEMRFARGGFSEADVAAGLRHARAALAYAADDATALAIASIVLLHLGHDFEAASGAIARALSLNGSCAIAFFIGAHIHGFSGDPATADDYATRALRLSPFDPLGFLAHFAQGNVRVREGHYADAATHIAKAMQAISAISARDTPFKQQCWPRPAASMNSKSVARRVLELEPTFHFRPLLETFLCSRGRRY